MLKIKDDVDLKELEKFGIYPRYECSETTGETRIKELNTHYYTFEKLRFKKKKKILARLRPKNLSLTPFEYVLVIENEIDKLINLDILYDLIKADLVEKVD